MPLKVLARLCLVMLAILPFAGILPGSTTTGHAIEGPPIFSSSSSSRSSGSGGGGLNAGGLLGDGIDFKGGMLDWEEDEEGNRVAILRNYAVVILPQLTVSARNIVLNVEQQELYAEGDVLFNEAGGNAFYCDQLTFNYEEWNGLAKNIRIKMDREGVDLPVRDFLDDAPSVDVSGPRSLNDAQAGMGQLKRMYVQAQELRAHDNNTFELIDAKVTPSSFARPHWYFHSPAALYRQKEKIESYHNTVRVGRVPVLYFPYLIRDLQYDWPWMRIMAGQSSDHGYYIRSQWGWKFEENENAFFRMNKMIFDVDLFSRRGIGLGVESTYEMGDWDSFGKFKVYGVWEALTNNSRDTKRAYNKNEDRQYAYHSDWTPTSYKGDFRWAIDWEHYQQLNDLWDVRAEAHLYHDRDYLKDYDSSRYWNDKEPENSIVFRRLDRNWELEFVASSRLTNKWMNQADYLPEVRLTVPGVQIGDMDLYFKNDMRVGFVNRRFDEDQYKYESSGEYYLKEDGTVGLSYPSDGLFSWDPLSGHSKSRLYDKDNYGNYFRAFNEMRIEAPLKAGSMVFKPWLGLRTAYYSKTLGQDYTYEEILNMTQEQFDALPAAARNAAYFAYQDGVYMYDPALRHSKGKGEYDVAVPFGIEASTRMYTFFGQYDQWRLTTEPKIKWTENTRARLDYQRDVIPVDSYDEYQRQRRFSYETAMKLQHRDGGKDGRTRDVLDFSFGVHQYPRSKDRTAVNHGAKWSELTADAIFRVNDHLSLSGSISYDIDDSKTNRGILGADWRLNDKFRMALTHYTYRGNYWAAPTTNPSTQTHLAVRTKLWNDSSHYSFEGAIAYEWKDSDQDWEEKRDGVRHGFSKYRATLYRDLDTFEMSLSYVRDRNADNHGVHFGLSPKSFMGYERPAPAYTMDVEELTEGRYAGQTAHFLTDGYRIDPPVRDADIRDVQF